jgi:nucleoid DNA-binding protein
LEHERVGQAGLIFPPSVLDRFSQENRVVTKKEIVKTISDEIGLTQLKTKEIVQKTFDAIVETLVEEKRIELRNFGVFEVKKRAARKARNPRTGAKVFVPEKFVVTFKPGKEMEEKVRELERQAAERAKAAETAGGGSSDGNNTTSGPGRGVNETRGPASSYGG